MVVMIDHDHNHDHDPDPEFGLVVIELQRNRKVAEQVGMYVTVSDYALFSAA